MCKRAISEMRPCSVNALRLCSLLCLWSFLNTPAALRYTVRVGAVLQKSARFTGLTVGGPWSHGGPSFATLTCDGALLLGEEARGTLDAAQLWCGCPGRVAKRTRWAEIALIVTGGRSGTGEAACGAVLAGGSVGGGGDVAPGARGARHTLGPVVAGVRTGTTRIARVRPDSRHVTGRATVRGCCVESC